LARGDLREVGLVLLPLGHLLLLLRHLLLEVPLDKNEPQNRK
jgi:hypothetical protein